MSRPRTKKSPPGRILGGLFVGKKAARSSYFLGPGFGRGEGRQFIVPPMRALLGYPRPGLNPGQEYRLPPSETDVNRQLNKATSPERPELPSP